MTSNSVKVGIFFFIGIVLFCAGLFLIGTRSNLFGSHFVVYGRFNNVQGLTAGSNVRVGGMDAGQLTDIKVSDSPGKKFRLELSVDRKFHAMIRKDSTASIET